MDSTPGDPSSLQPRSDGYCSYVRSRRWSLSFTGLLMGMFLLMWVVMFSTPHGPTWIPEPILIAIAVGWLAMALILNVSAIITAVTAILTFIHASHRPLPGFIVTCITLVFHAILVIFLGPGTLLLLIYFLLALMGQDVSFR